MIIYKGPKMPEEEEQKFKEGFMNAAAPLIEWINANCPSSVRATVMHKGAELSSAFAWCFDDKTDGAKH